MIRRVLAICGAILLLVGIGLAIYLHSLTSSALALDKKLEKGIQCAPVLDCPTGSGGTSGPPPPASEVCPSSWSLDIPQRVISQNDILPLNFVLVNQNNRRGCTVTIRLNTPGFDPSPPNQPTITVYVPPHATIKRILWYVTPERAGQLYIDANLEQPSTTATSADSLGGAQAVNYELGEIIKGISVNNVFGVSPAIASWSSLLWSIFGAGILSIVFSYKLWSKIYKGAKNFARRNRILGRNMGGAPVVPQPQPAPPAQPVRLATAVIVENLPTQRRVPEAKVVDPRFIAAPPQVGFRRGTLVVRTGPSAGMRYEITTPRIIVGRRTVNSSTGDVPMMQVDDIRVSHHHLEIFVRADGMYARDLGSTNGSWLNGRQLSGEPALLEDGAEIQIGPETRLSFRAN